MRRDNAVTVRLSNREYEQLSHIAQYYEVTLSEALRMIIMDEWAVKKASQMKVDVDE